jgi:hypothetical protein
MGTVTAVAEASFTQTPDVVFTAVQDYRTTRPELLPEQYTDYAVLDGGSGVGTVVTWRLHATKKRVRHVVADVRADGNTLIETDQNSSLVTRWEVEPHGAGSTVRITTTWNGAIGIGGFFERTFAPRGLAKIYADVLQNLRAQLSR